MEIISVETIIHAIGGNRLFLFPWSKTTDMSTCWLILSFLTRLLPIFTNDAYYYIANGKLTAANLDILCAAVGKHPMLFYLDIPMRRMTLWFLKAGTSFRGMKINPCDRKWWHNSLNVGYGWASFVSFFLQIFPLPLIFFGNIICGLGGTKRLK